MKRNNDEQQTAAFHLQHLVQEQYEHSGTQTSCRAADCTVEEVIGDVDDTTQAQALKGNGKLNNQFI